MAYKGIHTVLYILSCKNQEYFKIGVCKEDTIERRIKSLQTGNPYTIILEYYDDRENATKAEAYLHRQLAEYQVSGEWFGNITLEQIRIKLFSFLDQA